jgi:hypothetical protein
VPDDESLLLNLSAPANLTEAAAAARKAIGAHTGSEAVAG